MKYFFQSKPSIILSLLISIATNCIAQSESTNTEQFYNELNQLYGANQIPLIGKLNEYQPRRNDNHPYLNGNEYQKGTITLHGIIYTQVDLLYDIYEQQVVVLYLDPQNTKYGIIPPIDFISDFSIGATQFKKYCFSEECNFYEVVFNDSITCLYTWHKKRAESHENRAYVTYEYHSKKRKSYLLINNEIIEYSGNSSFIKVFPKHHKKSIANYIKANEIDVRKSDNQTISLLVKHCQQFLQ